MAHVVPAHEEQQRKDYAFNSLLSAGRMNAPDGAMRPLFIVAPRSAPADFSDFSDDAEKMRVKPLLA